MSRISFRIQIWGCCPTSWVRRVQVVQNNAVRFLLKKPRTLFTQDLLTDCRWLSVNQMIVYHSILLLWKLMQGNNDLNLMLRITYSSGEAMSTREGRKKITRAS